MAGQGDTGAAEKSSRPPPPSGGLLCRGGGGGHRGRHALDLGVYTRVGGRVTRPCTCGCLCRFTILYDKVLHVRTFSKLYKTPTAQMHSVGLHGPGRQPWMCGAADSNTVDRVHTFRT